MKMTTPPFAEETTSGVDTVHSLAILTINVEVSRQHRTHAMTIEDAVSRRREYTSVVAVTNTAGAASRHGTDSIIATTRVGVRSALDATTNHRRVTKRDGVLATMVDKKATSRREYLSVVAVTNTVGAASRHGTGGIITTTRVGVRSALDATTSRRRATTGDGTRAPTSAND